MAKRLRGIFPTLLILLSASGALAQGDEVVTTPPPSVPSTSPTLEVVPLIFPIIGKLSEKLVDTFGAARVGHSHIGQDLMAPKLTPLVATFDGTVAFSRTDKPNAHNILYLNGDNGWQAIYMHINNDTPGSDNDGLGSLEYAFAPDLRPGMHVVAGQFLGWVGNSGNAETVGPHLHFELHKKEGGVIDAFPSLQRAEHIDAPRYSLPVPEEKPSKGEVRMDAVVRLTDTARQVVNVYPVAYRNAEGKLTVVTKPLKKWLKLSDGATLIRRDGANSVVTLAELNPGDQLTLFIPESTETDTLTSRRILVEKMPVSEMRVARRTKTKPVVVASESAGDGTDDTTPSDNSVNPSVSTEPVPTSVRRESTRRVPDSLLAPPADIIERLTAHLNFYRAQRSLGAVECDSRLNHVAQSCAESLALRGYDERVDLSRIESERLLRDVGYKTPEFYLSVGVQQSTPEKAIEAWKSRRSEQVGLFHPAVTQIGIGYCERSQPTGRPQRYWVLLLATPPASTGRQQPSKR